MADDKNNEETSKCLPENTHESEDQETVKRTDVDEQIQQPCLQWTVGFLSMVTIVILIALLSVTLVWHFKRVEDLKPREHVICLNSSDLTSQHEEPNVLDQFKCGNGECCGTTSKILKRLVEKNTKEKYIDDLSNNFFASAKEECRSDQIPEKPAAKVAGISFIEMNNDESSPEIVHWNMTGPNSFTKRKLTYVNGNIYIAEPGFYYVFNQLKFSTNTSNTTPIVHMVKKHSYAQGGYEVLLEGRKSKCIELNEDGETTSSVGAVFELDEGDKIFVTTNKAENLVPCHHGNYFGLYLVASKVPD